MRENKPMEQLLSDDIERCEQYLEYSNSELEGKELYIEIAAKYDGVIKNFGNGLYRYFPETHFYDPEVWGESLIHNIKTLKNRMIAYRSAKYPPKSEDISSAPNTIFNNKIFIVHGHDNEAVQEMARTLEKGGFEAIILHEQPNAGMTIIEKIERYTNVGFAVVLYTECDLGRSKEEPVESEKRRARQNVVFEHGYLISKLGRKRVCALVKGDVETPGDISGVVYIPMDDNGAWKMQLAINMQDIGFTVDMNKLCR